LSKKTYRTKVFHGGLEGNYTWCKKIHYTKWTWTKKVGASSPTAWIESLFILDLFLLTFEITLSLIALMHFRVLNFCI
jgi:hypothetical protein